MIDGLHEDLTCERETRAWQKEAKCAACGGVDPKCDGSAPLVLNSICHTREGVRVSYVKKIHSLILECATCGKHIVNISLDAPVATASSMKTRNAKKAAFYTCKKCGFLHPVELRVEACKKDRSLFDMAILNERFGVDGWIDVSSELATQS